MPSVRQGFREKYRKPPARMIFSETACGLTLPSDKKRLPTLPCSSRFANVCVFSPFPFLPVSFPVVTDTKRAARSRTAPLCCNDKFRACSISSDFRRPENWKSHATLTLLAKQDLPTFGYNMIAPLKSWCWGSILFYPFKISRFS